MSQPIQGPDGKLYQFPDGTTKERAIAYFRSRGIGVTPAAPAALAPPAETSATSRFTSSAVAPIEGAAKGIYQAVSVPPQSKTEEIVNLLPGGLAVKRMLVDPAIGQAEEAISKYKTGDTSEALGHGLAAIVPGVGPWTAQVAEELGKEAGAGNYAGAAGTVVGNAAIALAPKAVGPVTRGLLDTASRAREGVQAASQKMVGTGPRVVRNLVKDVKTGNAAADSYSALRARIETARESALKIGNEKYSSVNEKLNHLPADSATIENAVAEAKGKIKGSETEPPILKDISSRLERGDFVYHGGHKFGPGTQVYESVKASDGGLPGGESKPLSYADLQGYYSELGTVLSKGNLPGDIYTALDSLHEAIGNEMQKIADANGQGLQLTDARDYWRRMKQAFGKQYSPSDAGNAVLESVNPQMAKSAWLANQVRLQSAFDPEIANDYRAAVNASEAAKGKPSAVPGETRRISAEDIQREKKKAWIVDKAPHRARQVGYSLGVIWPAIDVIRDVVRGEMPSVGGLAGSTAGITGGAHVIAGILERPGVVEFFTKATPKDLEQIPPDLRGDMPAIVKVAKAQGIKVSPALSALAGSASVGPNTRKLQQLRDQSIYPITAVNRDGHRIGSHDGQTWVDTQTGAPVQP